MTAAKPLKKRFYPANRKKPKWRHMPYGVRKQSEVVDYLERRINAYKSVNIPINNNELYIECKQKYSVSASTARRWWEWYVRYGELRYYGRQKEREYIKQHNVLPHNTKINTNDLKLLKTIFDDSPALYLDEIALLFGRRSGKYLSRSTIWKYASKYLGYTMQAISERSNNVCELTRSAFTTSLRILLDGRPNMLVMVDETHKDRNASRRRKGWTRRNGAGLVLNSWYRYEVRYTLIAAADINGFIEPACLTVDRDEISQEGAAGTVNREFYTMWVKEYLCPVLGNFRNREPRSVVLLDNASTHMSDEVVDAIRHTGAQIIYSAPYSPDLNPIENYFSVYKAHLKKYSVQMKLNWTSVHKDALRKVNRDMGVRYFCKCGIPGSTNVYTTLEQLQILQYIQFLSYIAFVSNARNAMMCHRYY